MSKFCVKQNGDLLLAKFDSTGNLLWIKTFGGTGYDAGRFVTEASDGGFVVLGNVAFGFGIGWDDFLLAKFDASGNHFWTRTLGGTGSEVGNSLIEAPDGGLIVTGSTYSFGAGSNDLLLAKFDSTGNHLWTRTLGGTGNEFGNSVVEASDGGFVVTGGSESFGAGDCDLLLAKFDVDGNTCMGEFISPTVTSPSPTIISPTLTVTTPSPTITNPDPTITSPAPTIAVVCDERAPAILSITDVGNDQGKQARVKWHRCSYDEAGSSVTITEYSLWRRVDQYRASGSEGGISPTKEGNPYGRMAYPPGEWDFVKTVPARCESSYSTICPTVADSTITDGMYWSVFFVSAMTSDPLCNFDSDPDSGYSVDNLGTTWHQRCLKA